MKIINVLNDSVMLNLVNGWQGISFRNYPQPDAVADIFNGYEDYFVYLFNYDGYYWPSQNTNTIGNWDCTSGYVIKMNTSVPFSVNGWNRDNNILTLDAGWNICPVLSECTNINVVELFTGSDIEIVKEVAGYGVYWPDFNINTLGVFNANKAYYVRSNEVAQIEFPQCDGKNNGSTTGGYVYQQHLPANLPWEITNPTALSHTIAIPIEAVKDLNLQPGDVIAAFDGAANCYGTIQWQNKSTSISLFGNDQTTSEKDGFIDGDMISFKYFNPATEKSFDLIVEYDESLPQADGHYYGNGLSAILKAEVGSTGINNFNSQSFRVYPNPADEVLHVAKGFVGHTELSLVNIQGIKVYTTEFDGLKTEINIKGLPAGVYFVEINRLFAVL